jgi:hypothetical protein
VAEHIGLIAKSITALVASIVRGTALGFAFGVISGRLLALVTATAVGHVVGWVGGFAAMNRLQNRAGLESPRTPPANAPVVGWIRVDGKSVSDPQPPTARMLAKRKCPRG